MVDILYTLENQYYIWLNSYNTHLVRIKAIRSQAFTIGKANSVLPDRTKSFIHRFNNDDMAALTYLPDDPNRYPNYNWQGLDAGEIVMGKPLVDTLLKYNDPQ